MVSRLSIATMFSARLLHSLAYTRLPIFAVQKYGGSSLTKNTKRIVRSGGSRRQRSPSSVTRGSASCEPPHIRASASVAASRSSAPTAPKYPIRDRLVETNLHCQGHGARPHLPSGPPLRGGSQCPVPCPYLSFFPLPPLSLSLPLPLSESSPCPFLGCSA